MNLLTTIVNILPKISENIGNIYKIVEIFKFTEKVRPKKEKEWIELNVGGESFVTSKSVMKNQPNSIFVLMLEADNLAKQQEILQMDDLNKEQIQKRMNKWGKKGDIYLFDRDPQYFTSILSYLRTGRLCESDKISLDGIKEEAKFYELKSLEKEIRKIIYQKKKIEKEKAPNELE